MMTLITAVSLATLLWIFPGASCLSTQAGPALAPMNSITSGAGHTSGVSPGICPSLDRILQQGASSPWPTAILDIEGSSNGRYLEGPLGLEGSCNYPSGALSRFDADSQKPLVMATEPCNSREASLAYSKTWAIWGSWGPVS